MRKIIVVLTLLSAAFSWAQNSIEKLPKFENCKSVPENEAESCFNATIHDIFRSNFNKELTQEKTAVIALFAVDTLGNFSVLYLDA